MCFSESSQRDVVDTLPPLLPAASRILIIRPGATGDTLLAFPIIAAIRKACANPHITLVGNPTVLPLALATGLVDEAFDYGHLQWSSLFSVSGIHSPAVLDQLQRTDLAICWLRDPGGMLEQNLRQASVRKVIVAPGHPAEGQHIHIVTYLARTIGLPHIEIPYRLSLKTAQHSTHYSANPRVAVHPGSGGDQKCWPSSSFAALIAQLWHRNYPVLLLAGPADHQRIEAIQRLLPPPQPGMFASLIDEPLLLVAQCLQQYSCYIGNDSGITHLAAMLGVPTIALFGPTDPAIWQPIGPTVTIIQKHPLQTLPVETALSAVLHHM